MPSYTLNILFEDAEDLQTVYDAQERLTLMKQTEPGSQLAWIAFDPFKNNTIQWSDSYAVYAAKEKVQSGATINRLADTPATPKKIYSFADGAFASGKKASHLGPGQYEINNDYGQEDWLTFGLAQSVQVNGTAFPDHPINAVVVPYKHTAVFTPHEKITVMLRASMQNSLVMSDVASEGLTLTYGGGVVEHTIRYEANSGRFVKVG